jgi:hypothetical protein
MEEEESQSQDGSQSVFSNADTIQSKASGLIAQAVDEANRKHSEPDAFGSADAAASAGGGSEVMINEASKISDMTDSQYSQQFTNSSGAGGAGVDEDISVRDVEDNLLEYLEALNLITAKRDTVTKLVDLLLESVTLSGSEIINKI